MGDMDPASSSSTRAVLDLARKVQSEPGLPVDPTPPSPPAQPRSRSSTGPRDPKSGARLLIGRKLGDAPRPSIGFHTAGAKVRRGSRTVIATAADAHAITIAGTGRGKGRNAIAPNLLHYPGPAIVIDTKPELAAITARARREMGQKVVIIDPFECYGPGEGGFNPLDASGAVGTAEDLPAFTIEQALLLSGGQFSLKDPFWDHKANNLNAAVIGAVLCNPSLEPGQKNYTAVGNLLGGDDPKYQLAVVLDTLKKSLPNQVYSELAGFLSTEERCRSGIEATAQQHLTVLRDPRIARAMSRTTFDLRAVLEGKPLTIYLVMPAYRLGGFGRILRLWLGTLLNLLQRRRGRPEHPTLFLIDEAAQLGPMDGLRTLMTLMRGFGVVCWSFWQDVSQLKRHYPEDWSLFFSNARTVQTFGVSSYLAAKGLSEVMNVSPDALLRLRDDEQFVVTDGLPAERLRKIDYLRDPLCRGRFDDNPLHTTRATTAALTPPDATGK